MTKNEIKTELDKIGISYSEEATKSELEEMYNEVIQQNGDTHDEIIEKEIVKEIKVELNEEVVVNEKQASLVDCFRQLSMGNMKKKHI